MEITIDPQVIEQLRKMWVLLRPHLRPKAIE